MAGSTHGSKSADDEPTPGRAVAGSAVTLESPELQLLAQRMRYQQEAHEAAMQQQEANRKQQDLQFQLLSEQLKALRAETSASQDAKDDAATKKATTGDAELEKLKKLPYCPYADVDPFPTRPDIMTDCMAKIFDLYGDKTHTTLCKKADTSMKFKQMVLGPALAYFHDAIVYKETTMDMIEDLSKVEHAPFLNELWDRMLCAHNTKRGVYGTLCNRYTMIGYRAMLEGDNEASGGADAVRAKLAFMEQKIYSSTEGVVADSVLTKWLAEFDSSKAKAVTTTTAKSSGARCRSMCEAGKELGARGPRAARRDGGLRRHSGQAGARVLPYMVITQTRDDAFVQRDRVEKLLSRLEGLFRVTKARLKKIHAKATALICRAAREQRWVQARELAGFNGLCQSVYLAVPAARLYLRELYFVLGKKRSWGSKARYIRSEAIEWADRLSWDQDLDDWMIYGRVNPPLGLLDAVAHKLREEGAAATVVAPYWPGRAWFRELEALSEELWLPASAKTVQLYVAPLLELGTVNYTPLQPYLSAINCFHEDFKFPGPAKGRATTRAVKGMTAMQTEAAEQQDVGGDSEDLPAKASAVRARDYAGTAAISVPAPIDIKKVEIIFASVKTKFSATLPTLSDLEEAVCDHWDNILTVENSASSTACALASEDKRTHDHVECKTCNRKGHNTGHCFLTSTVRRAGFLQPRPEMREKIMQRVQDCEKNCKQPRDAAAVSSGSIVILGIADTGEGLVACVLEDAI
ncbi:hypothetical protein CYMTET_7774 [Cymbomonas tetramitiformis]|uniref:Uncharacterized protein n=1 Tax=Cymbomonas tetramitiformis TaxID=36881 RepID=A0AAE0GWA5_9CHLO|nr:hypothetical protein CYMTET_7774 [Cymbomonas tetramitiformis]